jgi:hypothetical protein
MFDETLLFSLHVFLLGLLFCDRAFAAYNLTSPEELSRLTIPLGCNELPLRLNRMLDNIPMFRKAERTLHGWNISSNKLLPYSTLLPWIQTLGEVTGFAQVTRSFLLRYAGGKTFNENGKCCNLFYARCILCKRLDLCWPQWVHFGSQEHHGTSWNPMEPHGISRNLMESHRTSWNPTEPHGISQNLMEFHGRFWNMAESSGC